MNGNPEDLDVDPDASVFTLGVNAVDLFSGIRTPNLGGSFSWQVMLHRKDNRSVSPYVLVNRESPSVGPNWTFLNEKMRHEVQTIPDEMLWGGNDRYRSRKTIPMNIKMKTCVNDGIGDKDAIIDKGADLYRPIDWQVERVLPIKRFYEGLISLRNYKSPRRDRIYPLTWRRCDSTLGLDECSRQTTLEDIDEVPRIIGDIRGKGFLRSENPNWEIFRSSEVQFPVPRPTASEVGLSQSRPKILHGAIALIRSFVTRLYSSPNHSKAAEDSC